jgi:tRNA A37 threonylcarbamoyladenosine synthetase subunit TsaC/SUA5/YrdC
MNEEAVRGIFAAKERPFFDPLIVHIAQLEQLEGLVVDLDPRAKLLMDHFWPGPLTMVLKKHPAVPSIVTANSQTVAIRMPSNPLALNLIKASGKAIAAPSANRFAYTSRLPRFMCASSSGRGSMQFLMEAHAPLALNPRYSHSAPKSPPYSDRGKSD